MVSSKLHNMFVGSAVLLTAVTGTFAWPRVAASPAVLFLAAQVQMATGNTTSGLSLINRLAQTAPGKVQPANKPSPAKQDLNCKMNSRPQALRAAPVKVTETVNSRNEFPSPRFSAPIPMFAGIAEPAAFDNLGTKSPTPRVPTAQEINRQVRHLQERVNRSIRQQNFMKEAALRAALSNLQQSGPASKLENASEQVQAYRILKN